MKLLYCDDEVIYPEQDNVLYIELEEAMKGKGLSPVITVARTGAESDKMLIEEAFDGVILDIQMPAGTNPPPYLKGVLSFRVGIKIIEKFLNQGFELNRNIPLVILTGTGVNEVIKKINALVAQHDNIKYMTKPKLMETVLEELLSIK